jgi:hypothetical protein
MERGLVGDRPCALLGKLRPDRIVTAAEEAGVRSAQQPEVDLGVYWSYASFSGVAYGLDGWRRLEQAHGGGLRTVPVQGAEIKPADQLLHPDRGRFDAPCPPWIGWRESGTPYLKAQHFQVPVCLSHRFLTLPRGAGLDQDFEQIVQPAFDPLAEDETIRARPRVARTPPGALVPIPSLRFPEPLGGGRNKAPGGVRATRGREDQR